MISDGNYYLVAYDNEAETVKHFREDKMTDLTLTAEPRAASVCEGRFNPAEYAGKIFGMYGGKEELVTLDFSERLAGVVIDRFGKDVSYFKNSLTAQTGHNNITDAAHFFTS